MDVDFWDLRVFCFNELFAGNQFEKTNHVEIGTAEYVTTNEN